MAPSSINFWFTEELGECQAGGSPQILPRREHWASPVTCPEGYPEAAGEQSGAPALAKGKWVLPLQHHPPGEALRLSRPRVAGIHGTGAMEHGQCDTCQALSRQVLGLSTSRCEGHIAVSRGIAVESKLMCWWLSCAASIGGALSGEARALLPGMCCEGPRSPSLGSVIWLHFII